MIERTYSRGEREGSKPCMVAFADNLPDLLQWLDTAPRQWSCRLSEESRDYDWDLGADWKTTLAMTRDGWSEGANKIFSGLGALAVPSHGIIPKHGYGVAGDQPDVARFLAGDPTNMRTRKKVKGQSPVVHIVLNNVVSGSTDANNIANFGLAIAGLVDSLESAGRRVEIDIIISNPMNGKGRGVLGWKVKQASEPMDLAAVAFSIGHPAAFRRLGFAMIERTQKEWESYGYGHCEDITEQDAADIGADGAFLINGMRHNPNRCRTPKDALLFAATEINKAVGETLIELEELKQAA